MSRLERILVSAVVLIVLVLVSVAGVRWYGAGRYQAGHAAAVAERKAADDAAILTRTKENAVLAQLQGETNLKITEAKHEELAPVRERIVVERVRVGAAICGPAAAPDTESAAGGDSANPPGRLVREDAERDIVELKLAVEEDLATGRACRLSYARTGWCADGLPPRHADRGRLSIQLRWKLSAGFWQTPRLRLGQHPCRHLRKNPTRREPFKENQAAFWLGIGIAIPLRTQARHLRTSAVVTGSSR